MMPLPTITLDQFMELNPWKVADLLGLHYNGDGSPFPHGGFYYEAEHWEQYGYAYCVSFDRYELGTFVTFGTVNKPDDMASALASCEYEGQDPDNIHEQIIASQCFGGIEAADDMGGPYCLSFTPEQEREGMTIAREWVLDLAMYADSARKYRASHP